MMPLMIAILSVCILHEGLKFREIIALLFSFGGVFCLVFGREDTIKTEEGELEILAILLLILGTFLTSIGFIFLR
jgi:drug/metabolite transporter (DMT)-like permease